MLLASRPPPVLPPGESYCLFLDFDGTLVEFAPTPAAVTADRPLIALLRQTAHALDGALAIVSGRPVHDMDKLLAPLQLPMAGVHGYERRAADGNLYRPTPDTVRLALLREKLLAFVQQLPGLLLEEKPAGMAVHFRQARHLEGAVRSCMQVHAAAHRGELDLLEGDAVIELKPSTHTKATAVEAFMQESPFAGRTPVYIGDDHTDRDGFEAVARHGGMAIAVGTRVSTPWRLRDPAAVRAWLADFNSMSVAP